MKPVDVKPNRYIYFNVENNGKGSESLVDDDVRISIYKSIFAKVFILNKSEVDFMIKKIKNTVLRTCCVIQDFNAKNCLNVLRNKTNQREIGTEK